MIASALIWIATVATAGNTAWCEAGREYGDGAAVLQTARNHARQLRRPLLVVLTTPGRFAWACVRSGARTGVDWRHVGMGVAATVGDIAGPDWMRRSYAYCGAHDRPGVCARRCLPPEARAALPAGDWTQAGAMPGACPVVGEGRVMTYYGDGR